MTAAACWDNAWCWRCASSMACWICTLGSAYSSIFDENAAMRYFQAFVNGLAISWGAFLRDQWGPAPFDQPGPHPAKPNQTKPRADSMVSAARQRFHQPPENQGLPRTPAGTCPAQAATSSAASVSGTS